MAGMPNFVPVEASSLLQTDQHQGVTITRVRNVKFSKKSFLGRVLGLVTYILMALWAGLRSRRPDVIVVQTDPPVLGVLGALLGRWHRCPFIYYLQDLHPEIGLALGKMRPGPLTRLLYWASQAGFRAADRIVVLGPDMRARVLARGIPAKKITIVPNWADTDLIYPRPPLSQTAPMAPDHPLVVMYSGNLGLSQNLDQLLAAARDLQDQPIRFEIIGEGAAKTRLMAQADAWKLTNVRFSPYTAKEKLQQSLTTADVHFIPLRKGLAGAIVPSKLYGILAAGVPFIAAVDPDSEVARVAQATGAGLVIAPESLPDLITTLHWCLQNRPQLPTMGLRGRHAAVTQFSRPVCVRQLENVITAVAAHKRATAHELHENSVKSPIFAV